MKEEELERKIVKNLEIIEPGLILIERQKRTNLGVIDLFCRDKDRNYVIIEIKKKATPTVIAQLAKYNMALIKNAIPEKKLRTILVAQEVSKTIKEICEFFNFEIKILQKRRKINKKSIKITLRNESNFSKTHMKVLQYLVKIRGLDFTISDVARNTNMTRVTLYKIWKDLEDMRIIEESRKIGVAKLYKLNEDNEITKALINLYKVLLSQMVEEQEDKIKVIA